MEMKFFCSLKVSFQVLDKEVVKFPSSNLNFGSGTIFVIYCFLPTSPAHEGVPLNRTDFLSECEGSVKALLLISVTDSSIQCVWFAVAK
jgi:hypothetical protein